MILHTPLRALRPCRRILSQSRPYSAQSYYKGILSQMWLWSYRFSDQFSLQPETLLYFNTSEEQIKISISSSVPNSMKWQPQLCPLILTREQSQTICLGLANWHWIFNKVDPDQIQPSLTSVADFKAQRGKAPLITSQRKGIIAFIDYWYLDTQKNWFCLQFTMSEKQKRIQLEVDTVCDEISSE